MGKSRKNKRNRENVSTGDSAKRTKLVDRQQQQQNGNENSKRNRGSKRQRQPQATTISKADHDAILKALREVEWSKVINTSRRNVIPDDAKRESKGKQYCHSFILGPGMKDPNKAPSYWTEQCPELYRLLQDLMRRVDGNHVYTNITVNKNLRCKAHRDRGNYGMSYICGFGNYTGGELMVAPRKPQDKVINEAKERKLATPVDLHSKFVPFYGGEQLHWTKDFKGERYTVVFYNFPELHKSAVVKAAVGSDMKGEETPDMTAPQGEFATRLANLSKRLKKSQKKMFTK